MMLLDTSGLLCYFDAGDHRHPHAEALFNAARVKIVHSYILAEFVALCQTRKLNRNEALLLTAEFADNPHIEMIWLDATLHGASLELLQDRMDKTYSLCDAVSADTAWELFHRADRSEAETYLRDRAALWPPGLFLPLLF